MKIAFFGLYGSFGHYNIGGTDSIVRRISYELVEKGHKVDFVTYGAPKRNFLQGENNVPVYDFESINDAFDAMAGVYDHVITIYLLPRQRLSYLLFRRHEGNRTYFHYIFQAWPESPLKRRLMFAESRLYPYNGFLFCVSPRLNNYVSKFSKRSVLLFPPVPEDYFLTQEKKPENKRLSVTYMGRLDPGKGIAFAIELFRYMAEKSPEIQTRIYGYPWKYNPETKRIHDELLAQDTIYYEATEYEKYSPTVDEKVQNVLRETDILFLPYDKLSSTIDTPLLLLEGMAHLCIVVTRPLGDMPEIYGTNDSMGPTLSDHNACLNLIKNASLELGRERSRLETRCRELKFSVSEVVETLLNCLNSV